MTDLWLAHLGEEYEQSTRKRYWGVYYGIVESVDDPLELGRLRIRAPQYHDESTLPTESLPWAHYVSPYGGSPDVGFYFIPPVGSQVLITFVDGHPWYPVWLGCVYAAPGGEPDTHASRIEDPHEDWKPTKYHGIRTPAGSVFEIDDNDVTTALVNNEPTEHTSFVAMRGLTPRGYGFRFEEDADPSSRLIDEEFYGHSRMETGGDRVLEMSDLDHQILLRSPEQEDHHLLLHSEDRYVELASSNTHRLVLDDAAAQATLTTAAGDELLFDEGRRRHFLRGRNQNMCLLVDEAADQFNAIGIYDRNAMRDTFVEVRREAGVTGSSIYIGLNISNQSGDGGAKPIIELSRGNASTPRQIYLRAHSGSDFGVQIVSDSFGSLRRGDIAVRSQNGMAITMLSGSALPTVRVASPAGEIEIAAMSLSDTAVRIIGPWTSRYFRHTHMAGTLFAGPVPVTGFTGMVTQGT